MTRPALAAAAVALAFAPLAPAFAATDNHTICHTIEQRAPWLVYCEPASAAEPSATAQHLIPPCAFHPICDTLADLDHRIGG